jgi:uncharacterized membrane protein
MENRNQRGKLADRIRAINRFLIDHHLYPLLLSSALACGLIVGRVTVYRTWMYAFLIWNLVLAWVPYAWSLCAASIHRRFPRRWWPLLMPGVVWLIFFPNAPYIVTDLLHLHDHAPVPLWYDAGLLAAFAFAGIFIAISSLHTMQSIVEDLANRTIGWLFAIGIIGLTGFGVYLGRFLRWNTWDLFLNPIDVLGDAAHRLAHPLSNLQTYGFTLLFAAFLFGCYWMFTSMQPRTQESD